MIDRVYERSAVIPGRSLTRSKAVFNAWASHATGATIIDNDEHRYLDMVAALGAVTLGYSSDSGGVGVMSLPACEEVEAAEAVLSYVAPWASSIRFTMTGSEATHAAYRIAKAATGRTRVMVGAWSYHGWQEWCSLVRPDDIFAHGQDPNAFHGRHEDIAAVFIEPHRWEPVGVEWLRSVRAFCDRVGALLVFDSMIYGGRWALGGTSEYFGVIPDLECFGKALANGYPIGCVVGRDVLAEHGQIVSGTFSGFPPSLSAVIRTVNRYYTEPVVETLWKRGRQLARGIEAVIPAEIGHREGTPVHQRITFARENDGPAFMREMKARGVLWHPACANVMYAHTAADIERVIEAAEASALALLARRA